MFMDAVNVSKLAINVRPEMIDARTKKINEWIREVEIQSKTAFSQNVKRLAIDWDQKPVTKKTIN